MPDLEDETENKRTQTININAIKFIIHECLSNSWKTIKLDKVPLGSTYSTPLHLIPLEERDFRISALWRHLSSNGLKTIKNP